MRLVNLSGGKVAKTLVLVPITLLLLLTGCVNAKADSTANTISTIAPSIRLLNPWAGQTIPADQVKVLVEIKGFTVDIDSIGEAAVPGRGHWHLYLDGEFMQASGENSVVLEPLPSGPHHMRVALANNDHSPLNPPVEDSVVVDIVGGEKVQEMDIDPEY